MEQILNAPARKEDRNIHGCFFFERKAVICISTFAFGSMLYAEKTSHTEEDEEWASIMLILLVLHLFFIYFCLYSHSSSSFLTVILKKQLLAYPVFLW